jgi:transposase-like protein
MPCEGGRSAELIDKWDTVETPSGERMYLWRSVDHEGEVLDMLVQRRRDTRAALRLMRKLLKKQGFAPKLLVTDKLRSRPQNCGAVIHTLLTISPSAGQPPDSFVSSMRSAFRAIGQASQTNSIIDDPWLSVPQSARTRRLRSGNDRNARVRWLV